ncbi:MAG: 2-oxoglutarate dehydrogenase complex dihydrolipoyllysine-residue succinyltransferase [Chitinophagales bacterium]|nr:2-oxoglutarate dehydrogenase complex dihydrolipoyllysine-residue succinyltransferase [Chitinophagales bacterium]
MSIEMKVPSLGESITEVTLAQWLVSDGDYVKMDQPVAEMETDKASQELFAEKAGKIEFIASEGDDLAVGDVICKIDTSVEAPAESESKQTEPEEKEVAKVETQPAQVKKTESKSVSSKEASTSYAKGHPSPVAAKIIKEHQIDPASINGSGKSGRITKADVLSAITNGVGSSSKTKAFSRGERREKVSRLRKTIAERLVYAKNSTAMLTTFNEVDCTAMKEIRNLYKEKFKEKHGVSLGFMSFFTKACSIALQNFPAVNAYLDDKEVVYHDHVDISIAVSTPKGLVVPVIRNAESLSMAQIEETVKDLAIRGRDGDLSMEDMSGGTFTISNGGVFGSLLSTPILNPPQSAILGMHKIEDRPIALNGEVVIKPMMYLALSYDHRIIDGKESVSFLVMVKDLLENPEKLLVGEDPVKILLDL